MMYYEIRKNERGKRFNEILINSITGIRFPDLVGSLFFLRYTIFIRYDNA